jgi:serine/threonine-protein kinase
VGAAVVTKFGDRYELIRRIGAGGMGEVWLAHDAELAGRPVAIKIMHRHMLPNADDVARFEREMRFAAMMDHPNIVTVYTTGTWEEAPFMVMEYLRGHDLEQALPGGDAEHIAGIGRDICSGLAYAHREGVLHRDIKPANLFLCESGQVKITDFGVARAVDATTLSTIGVVVGTLAFLPPERWRGEPPAFSQDIWAVGCVLYRLISGRLPRLLPDVADYAAAATRGDPFADLRDITDAPGWLTGPVMAMLADDPALRPTAGECVQLLSSAQFPAPAVGLPVRSRHLPGQLGSGQTDPDPVTGAGAEDPVTAPVTRPDASRSAAARSRPARRAALAVAALLVLLLAGSITAWRLSSMPSDRRLAASGPVTTSPATGQAAGATPVSAAGSASRSSSAAPPPRSTAAVAPATSRSATQPSPRSTSPASPTAAPAPGGPSASPTNSPSASPFASAPASSTPPLVPVPDVVGMTFTQARLLLVGDGFTVLGRHTRLGQIVTRTNPSAGEVPAGSLIIVVYGTGTPLLRATVGLSSPVPTDGTQGPPRFPGAEQHFRIAAAMAMIRIPNLLKNFSNLTSRDHPGVFRHSGYDIRVSPLMLNLSTLLWCIGP